MRRVNDQRPTHLDVILPTQHEVIAALVDGHQSIPTLIDRFCAPLADTRMQHLVYAALTIRLYELHRDGCVMARTRFDPSLQVSILGYELTPAGRWLAGIHAA